MISFEVKSLFTSVPRDEAVSAVEQMLVADQSFTSKTGLTVSSKLDLLKVCVIAQFQFRHEHNELSDGLAVGPPSPLVIANIDLGKLEEKALSTFSKPPKLGGGMWTTYFPL